ncbi:MAG: glycosyltransferase family 4 protein [Dehalococcoidia bacterium]|nr:glycosyltransferase family 4 protein [Dehalococcoidia bacterium]
MMNIWFFSHYASTPREPGDTRDYYFAKELARGNVDSVIFASAFNHRTRKDQVLKNSRLFKTELFDGAKFIWLKTSPYYKGNDWRRILNMISYCICVMPVSLFYMKKADIIIGVTPHPLSALSAWMVSKLKGARFILDVRDLWPETLIAIGGFSRNSIIVKTLKALEKFLYRSADKIIVLMPNAIEYIQTLGISQDKVFYIPNGVSTELFENKNRRLPSNLHHQISIMKSEKRFLVGYIGAHGITDVLHIIVAAASLLQNMGHDEIRFILIGDGPEKNKLIQQAKQLNLSNIYFYEPIPKISMPSFLNAMDAVVITKKKTELFRFGVSFLKIFDYMMSARPVIWAVDAINNPVAEANCGITVTPEDAQALSEAIIHIYQLSPREREEMGKRGHEYVMRHHSVPVLARKLLEVIGNVNRN